MTTTTTRRNNSIGFDLHDMENTTSNDDDDDVAFFDDVSINTKQQQQQHTTTSSMIPMINNNNTDNNSDSGSSKNSGGNASKNSKNSKTSNRSGYSAGSSVAVAAVVVSDDLSFHSSAQDDNSIDSNYNSIQIGNDNFEDVKNAFQDSDNNTKNNFHLFRPKTWRQRRNSPSPNAPDNIDLELSWEEPFHDPNNNTVVKTGKINVSILGHHRSSSSPTTVKNRTTTRGVPPLKAVNTNTKKQLTMKSTTAILCALAFVAVTSWLSVLLMKTQLEMKLWNGMLRRSGQVNEALEAVLMSASNTNIGIGTVLIRFDTDQRLLVRIHVDDDDGTNGVIRSERGTWQLLENVACPVDSSSSMVAMTNNPWNDETFPTGPNIWTRSSIANTNNNNGVSVQTRYFAKTMEQLEGHAIVLFEEEGSVLLACGILKPKIPKPHVKHVLWAYLNNKNTNVLNNNNNNNSGGKVRLDFYPDDTFHFGFNLTTTTTTTVVVETQDEQPSPMTIENYESCQDVTEPRFYFATPVNPWTLANGAYHHHQSTTTTPKQQQPVVVDNHGFYMYDGYTYEQHIGRTVVMRDASGTVLACGELVLHREIDNLSKLMIGGGGGLHTNNNNDEGLKQEQS